jgi:hypothetical protein
MDMSKNVWLWDYSRPMRLLLVVGCGLALAACHADLTERLDVNPDKTVTVTYREVFDREMYANVSAAGGTDPFRAQLARSEGWGVAVADEPTDQPTVTYVKTVASSALAAVRLPDGLQSNDSGVGLTFSPGIALPFAVALAPRSGTSTTAIVPALMNPGDVLHRPGHDPAAASAVANALANAALVDAIVAVHLEIQRPSGTSCWDLHFATPTVLTFPTGDPGATIVRLAPIAVRSGDGNGGGGTPPIPQGANWSAVYASGVAYGLSPLAAWQSLGRYGTYAFERWGRSPADASDDRYLHARHFAVCVYSGGADLPEQIMGALYPIVDPHLK